MSLQYDNYLVNHKLNVRKAFNWLRENLPELIPTLQESGIDYEYQICFAHDASKGMPDEYDTYDAYFYGGNKSYAVVTEFDKAWLLHIHRNPHHWQHWILLKDDPDKTPEIRIEMPDNYIIEMICDWWSFSWANGNLFMIFAWYNEHKDHIRLNHSTRLKVENILNKIQTRLEAVEPNELG